MDEKKVKNIGFLIEQLKISLEFLRTETNEKQFELIFKNAIGDLESFIKRNN